MKKIFILLFSLLASFSSYGYWTETHLDNGDSVYVDFDYLKKKYDGTLSWRYLENKPNDKTMKSVVFFIEGDCKMGLTRIVSTTLYRELMGQDKILSDNRGYSWEPPKPDSTSYQTLNIVCSFL